MLDETEKLAAPPAGGSVVPAESLYVSLVSPQKTPHTISQNLTDSCALPMQNLPPGWRVSNSEGSYAGPPPIIDDEASDGSEERSDSDVDEGNPGALDIEPDSPGWEDVDPDADDEVLSVKCLICEECFNDSSVMLEHCRSEHSFDFLEIRRSHNLDFYSTIKLVNYIRSLVKEGELPDVPDLADPTVWNDERFLQPVLDEDALLFSLDDLIDFAEDVAEGTADEIAVDSEGLENAYQ